MGYLSGCVGGYLAYLCGPSSESGMNRKFSGCAPAITGATLVCRETRSDPHVVKCEPMTMTLGIELCKVAVLRSISFSTVSF